MVEEREARGRVAAVYTAVLDQAPFVPSLLKSLAVCPPYLVLAWEQLAPVLPTREMEAEVSELVDAVRDVARPPADPADRQRLAAFVGPLGRMLLAASGLLSAIDGELAHLPEARGQAPPGRSRPLPEGLPKASTLDADVLLTDIRTRLGTPIVNSIWRRLASDGRLSTIWQQLAPQVDAILPAAERLGEQARVGAKRLPWVCCADQRSLGGVGLDDAAPGLRAILEAYLTTLPRVLALAASSART